MYDLNRDVHYHGNFQTMTTQAAVLAKVSVPSLGKMSCLTLVAHLVNFGQRGDKSTMSGFRICNLSSRKTLH